MTNPNIKVNMIKPEQRTSALSQHSIKNLLTAMPAMRIAVPAIV